MVIVGPLKGTTWGRYRGLGLATGDGDIGAGNGDPRPSQEPPANGDSGTRAGHGDHRTPRSCLLMGTVTLGLVMVTQDAHGRW